MNLEDAYPQLLELLALLVVLVFLVAVGGRLIAKIRPKPAQQEPMASKMLSKYRELHSRGELSDAEFRTIKTTLAERFPDELKDDGQMGCDV